MLPFIKLILRQSIILSIQLNDGQMLCHCSFAYLILIIDYFIQK